MCAMPVAESPAAPPPPLPLRRSALRSLGMGVLALSLVLLPALGPLYAILTPDELSAAAVAVALLYAVMTHSDHAPRPHLRALVGLAAIALVLALPIGAQSLTSAPRTSYADLSVRDGVGRLRIVGPIRKDMAGPLLRDLARWDGPLRMCVDTPGGDVISALLLAQAVSARDAGAVIVARQCDSACALLWAAAAGRAALLRPGTQDITAVGLHRVYSGLPLLTPAVQAAYAWAMHTHGAAAHTLGRMMQFSEIWELSSAELAGSGIPGSIITPPEYAALCA